MANAIPVNSPAKAAEAKMPEVKTEVAPAVAPDVAAMIEAAVAKALAAQAAQAAPTVAPKKLEVIGELPKGFVIPKGATKVVVDERGSVRVDL